MCRGTQLSFNSKMKEWIHLEAELLQGKGCWKECAIRGSWLVQRVLGC